MEKLRIVVIEDEYYVRKGIITSFDWNALDSEIVGEAVNGKAGLELIEELHPDLAIVDIEMPEMNGIEMIKLLRGKKSTTEFIVLTAHQKFTYVHSALKLEVMDYLLKPFRQDELAEAIEKFKIKLGRASGTLGTDVVPIKEELKLTNSYIKKAIAYVREHYAQEVSNLSVSEYLDLNPAYFCRLFKRETGYTFVQYITNYRINVAAGLLKNFDMRVSEVSAQVGIPDSNYFSVVFKKIMGVSPSEYIENK